MINYGDLDNPYTWRELRSKSRGLRYFEIITIKLYNNGRRTMINNEDKVRLAKQDSSR